MIDLHINFKVIKDQALFSSNVKVANNISLLPIQCIIYSVIAICMVYKKKLNFYCVVTSVSIPDPFNFGQPDPDPLQ